MSTPGVRQYWETRKEVFSPEFKAYVDKLAIEKSSVIPSYLTAKELGKVNS